MISRIKYKTNGMGETTYIPQYRNFLGIWVTFREWVYPGDSVKSWYETEEEAANAIIARFENGLRNKTVIVGVTQPKGGE